MARHTEKEATMPLDEKLKAVQAARKAEGLVISFDRAPEHAHFGRATAAFATVKERDEEIDRLIWLGRNPRIECN